LLLLQLRQPDLDLGTIARDYFGDKAAYTLTGLRAISKEFKESNIEVVFF
jgi:hypothetical protein